MIIYSYTFPALIAFLSKIAILIYSLRAKLHNFQTRLFIGALLQSMLINMIEIAGFQKILSPEHALISHYAVHITMLAFLAQLAVSIAFDGLAIRFTAKIGVILYGYAAVLEYLLLFTPLLISGVEPLGGYTFTRTAGSLFWTYEVFVLICVLTLVGLPVWGMRNNPSPVVKSRCKLWVVLSVPLTALILAIVILLHLEIRWFNATVTTPLVMAIFMALIAYAVHHHRLIDPGIYLPWSHLKKSKSQLYTQLAALGSSIPNIRDIDTLLERFASILKCPVGLIGQETRMFGAHMNTSWSRIQRGSLHDIRQMVIANEIRESNPVLYDLMTQHKLAAIVPFFRHSNEVRHWLLLGESFSHSVSLPRDFREMELLFGKMAGVLLDSIMRIEHRTKKTKDISSAILQCEQTRKNLPLSTAVAEFEAELIRHALTSCKGNQAKAARLLGIRSNTLHYKITRYGL